MKSGAYCYTVIAFFSSKMVTVYEDKFTVKFKSGVAVDVNE